jgi:hypothetical protein
VIGCHPGSWHRCMCNGQDHSVYRQNFPHNSANVSQKVLGNLDLL